MHNLSSSLPLTLTLSLQAGRGDAIATPLDRGQEDAGIALLPVATGRRWRQPDEGQSPFAIAGFTENVRSNACF
jgi:hypothetical protein